MATQGAECAVYDCLVYTLIMQHESMHRRMLIVTQQGAAINGTDLTPLQILKLTHQGAAPDRGVESGIDDCVADSIGGVA